MKKKNRILIYSLIVMGFIFTFTHSCKKDEKNNDPITTPTSVTDIDGNIYHTVTIGTQVWMVENLKVTKYRNGDPIPNISDATAWSNLTTGAYCNYNNDANNLTTYGRLYHWYAVNDSRNIAPAGWHVPSDTELTTLLTYLGGVNIAGGKLKETGITHWNTPNEGATNQTGFTAVPGGYRIAGGTCNYMGSHGYWWCSTVSGTNGLYMRMYFGDTFVFQDGSVKKTGFSVRCLKD